MFNGIIYNTGLIKIIKQNRNSKLIGVKTNLKLKNKDIGSSICCSGVCLTLTKIKKNLIFFFVSNETIKRSNFRNLKIGSKINLETSLIYGKKISGNFSQGHVDCTAKIKKIDFIDKSWILKLEIQNKKFNKYLEEKASITINGVSLTISNVSKRIFLLNIIPHTLKLTNLIKLKNKDQVNIEFDMIGKYLNNIYR